MKTYTFTVTIPNVPDSMDPEEVRDWLWNSLLHPYDAAYEASVRVEWDSTYIPANPDRENNGCMINKKGSPPS